MEEQIGNILVPIDGSRNSLRGLKTAIDLAKKHNATLTIIHVTHRIPKDRTNRKISTLQKKIQSFMASREITEKNGIKYSSDVLVGKLGHEIINYINSHDIDLIVMGARGLSLKKIFLGSVSRYVMQKSKMHVIVVK